MLTRRCDECGVAFESARTGARGGKVPRFCSNPCRMAALQRLPRPTKGKSTGSLTRKGYRVVIVWEGDERRAVPEHRLVVERAVKRRLLPDEVVHHINHNRSDNRIENLELFSSHGEHMMQRHPERLRGRRLTAWSRSFPACISCGRTDSRHAARGVCARCLEQKRRDSQSPGVCTVCGENAVRYGGSGVCRSCAMKSSTARRRRPNCVNGHPFDEANTYWRPGGGRACRACGRASMARYTAKR